MGFGSNEAVQAAEEEYRKERAKVIAEVAAGLVAAGDMSSDDAIQAAIEWYRKDDAADGDVTGTLAAETKLPTPSKAAPPAQIAAIKDRLIEAVMEATEGL